MTAEAATTAAQPTGPADQRRTLAAEASSDAQNFQICANQR